MNPTNFVCGVIIILLRSVTKYPKAGGDRFDAYYPPVMEGDLGKIKSIHTSDSFLYSNYFGIVVNKYSINIAYMTFCTFVTCR